MTQSSNNSSDIGVKNKGHQMYQKVCKSNDAP